MSKRHVSGSPIKRRTEVKNTLPIGMIDGSKAPIETHTPLIRETPEISGQRAMVHFVLFLLCFYFGFISKPMQSK